MASVYSLSWHRNPAWSRRYPGAAEIQRYLAGAAAAAGITPHIKLRVAQP